jgi:hypothetical protein
MTDAVTTKSRKITLESAEARWSGPVPLAAQ